MKIKQKIAVMVGLPVLFLFVLVGLGWWSLSGLTKSMNSIVNDQFLTLIDKEITPLIADEMLPLINEDIEHLLGLQDSIVLMLEADRDVHQAVIAEKMALVASEEAEVQAANQGNAENIQQARDRMTKASAAFDSAESQKLYGEFQAAFADWEEKSRGVIEMANTPGKLQFARKASDTGSALTTFNAMRDLIDQLQQVQAKDVETILAGVETKKAKINEQEQGIGDKKKAVVDTYSDTESKASTTTILFILIGVIVGILSSIIGYFISRAIANPLLDCVGFAQAVAEGDLSQQVALQQKDEIGQLAGALNHMSHNLSEVMGSIQEAADQVAASSEQLSASAQNLSNGASDQAANVEETSASLEEMTTSIQKNSENSAEALRITSEAGPVMMEGSEKVSRTVEAMRQISEKIKIVDDIADQTNLLALNAAIEAARAGEMGKGFAVVAVEVRKLAERSQEAAKEITKISKESVDLAERAGEAINRVVPMAQKSAEMVQEVTMACKEQAIGAEQIMQAVTQLDQVTQQNSATSEEAASASEELAAQAQTMRDLISRFKIASSATGGLTGKTRTGAAKTGAPRLALRAPQASEGDAVEF